MVLLGETETIAKFTDLALKVLGWLERDLVAEEATLIQYEVNLREYQDILLPSFVVSDPHGEKPLLLVQELAPGQSFDEVDPTLSHQAWQVPPKLNLSGYCGKTKFLRVYCSMARLSA